MMSAIRAVAVTMGALASCLSAFSETPSPTFQGAKWIWYSREPMPLSQSFPAGVHYFRAALTLPADTQVKSAELIITADNLYSFFINGKLAGEGHANPNAWAQPKRFDVAAMLAPGRNVVAVEAVNTVPGPGALIVKLVAQLGDGKQITLATGEHWKSIGEEVPKWQQPEFDDKTDPLTPRRPPACGCVTISNFAPLIFSKYVCNSFASSFVMRAGFSAMTISARGWPSLTRKVSAA